MTDSNAEKIIDTLKKEKKYLQRKAKIRLSSSDAASGRSFQEAADAVEKEIARIEEGDAPNHDKALKQIAYRYRERVDAENVAGSIGWAQLVTDLLKARKSSYSVMDDE